MKTNNIRNCYNFKSNIANFFCAFKLILCLSFLLLVFGFVLGIVVANKYSANLEFDNLLDSGLVDFVKGDKSVVGLFFSYLLSFSVCFCLIAFVNIKPWLNTAAFLVLFARGYTVGFDVAVLVFAFGFAGVVNAVLVVLPLELLVWCVFVVLTSFSVKKCKTQNKYGCSNVSYAKVYWLLFGVGCFVLLVKCLVLPVMRITIIVG